MAHSPPLSACRSRRRRLAAAALLALGVVQAFAPASAAPVSASTLQRLSLGLPTWVVVEYDASQADGQAQQERLRRGLRYDDAKILQLRAQGYHLVKSHVTAAASGADVLGILDFEHLPSAAWRLTSRAALDRLLAQPEVRAVHENAALHAVSVSDLGFINQPAAAALGATGSGTTIAVIDGGLGNNYLSYPDFGSCTAIATPASTCRVVLQHSTYPGASAETTHGTNVSAIALGVAPQAKLAMFDVFNGTSASVADLLNAMSSAIGDQAAYNIVAINLSVGDSSSHSTICTTSVFASAVASASNAGIITVAAAGNSGSKTGLSEPACAPGVVSVGAVYDASYGSRSWVASGLSAGQCTDSNSAADLVTCFSQSASYLSLLAPGTFVNAPNASFQQTGTSQATPHVAGAVAVLRSSYPAESLNTTVQRLQTGAVAVTDPGNGRSAPRLNLLGAVQLGTSLTLTGTGTATAVAGTTSSYSLTASNKGPLMGDHVTITFQIPAGASLVSASSGCTTSASTVSCTTATLGVGSSYSVLIQLLWHVSGPIYAEASVTAEQINSAVAGQSALAFGSAPAQDGGDAPLPLWTWVLLAGGLFLASRVVPQMTMKKAQQVGKRLT